MQEFGYTRTLGDIDRAKLNVTGGSFATGHPFAATGGQGVSVIMEA